MRDDTEPSTLGSVFATENEAVAYAKKWLATNHASNKPSDWTYMKFVVVQGEATVRSKKNANAPKKTDDAAGKKDSEKKNPVTSDDPKDQLFYDVYNGLNEVLTKDGLEALKKKNMTVRDAFRRAMVAKDGIKRNVKRLAEDDFKKVNGLIAEYNGKLDRYSKETPGKEYFSRVPRLTPFSDEMIKQALGSQKEDLTGTVWIGTQTMTFTGSEDAIWDIKWVLKEKGELEVFRSQRRQGFETPNWYKPEIKSWKYDGTKLTTTDFIEVTLNGDVIEGKASKSYESGATRTDTYHLKRQP